RFDVEGYAGVRELLSELRAPCAFVVQFDVKDTVEVRRNFDTGFVERTDPASPQFSQEVAQLKHHILTSTGLQACAFILRGADIIWRKQYDSETHVGVLLELFNHRAPRVRLFMENDRLQ